MTRGLNWKEQLHWELYKQYLKTPIVSYTNKANMNETHYKYRQFNECYDQSKLATDQFINNLAADAREQLEHQGWEESDFRSMIKTIQSNGRIKAIGIATMPLREQYQALH